MPRPYKAKWIFSGFWMLLILGICTSITEGSPWFGFYSGKSKEVLNLLGIIIFATYILAAVIEYAVVRGFLRPLILSRSGLFLWVLLMNMITIPVAQVIWTYCIDVSQWFASSLLMLILIPFLKNIYLLFLIGFGVLSAQFLFLKWLFNRMYKRGVLATVVSRKHTLRIALIANAASFIFSGIDLIFLFYMKQELMVSFR